MPNAPSNAFQEKPTLDESPQINVPSNEIQELRAMLEKKQLMIADLTESNANLSRNQKNNRDPARWDHAKEGRKPVYSLMRFSLI